MATRISWKDLTAEKMTLFYLYGQGTKPSSDELVDDRWIGRNEMDITITDFASFMSDGPGRIANASQIPLIRSFFADNSLVSGTYTLERMMEVFYMVQTQMMILENLQVTHKCNKSDFKVYSTDCFNFIAFRGINKDNYTWTIEDKKFMKNFIIVADKLDLNIARLEITNIDMYNKK